MSNVGDAQILFSSFFAYFYVYIGQILYDGWEIKRM